MANTDTNIPEQPPPYSRLASWAGIGSIVLYFQWMSMILSGGLIDRSIQSLAATTGLSAKLISGGWLAALLLGGPALFMAGVATILDLRALPVRRGDSLGFLAIVLGALGSCASLLLGLALLSSGH